MKEKPILAGLVYWVAKRQLASSDKRLCGSGDRDGKGDEGRNEDREMVASNH